MTTKPKKQTLRIEPRQLKELVRLLQSLTVLHEGLLEVIREKLSAMKRADLQAMRDATVREQTLVATIQEREGLRRQLMDAIGDELVLSRRAARSISVSQLVKLIPVAPGRSLRAAADQLAQVMHKVAQSNRVAGATCREIVDHMKWVFAAVRPAAEAPVGYAGDGALVGPTSTKIFEAMG